MAKAAADSLVFEQYELPEPTSPQSAAIQDSPQGLILTNGQFISPNYVKGKAGWKMDSNGNFECVNGTFSGTLGAVSLNIPDSTTANSFHVDSNGNSWWGANVATGYTGANAYILNTGAAQFKNVSIGGTTVQYVITNSGIFSYGDSADGTATCDGSTAVAGMSLAGSTYTMTRDVYFNSLTINTGVTLQPSSFRLFIANTLTIAGTIDISGGDGGKGGTGTAGASSQGAGGGGGTVFASGYLKGAPTPGSGGSGGDGSANGVAGNGGGSVTNSIASGIASGVGGKGCDAFLTGGAAGGVGTFSAANVSLKVGVQLAQLLDVSSTGSTVKYTTSSGAGGGGGGAGTNAPAGGAGGGGGGGGGGILAIYARTITVSASGVIKANGGKGGDGGDINSSTGNGGGVGGGGGGGGGGLIILVYNTLTNSGSITTTGGTQGAIGTSILNGKTNGAVAGTAGSAGTIYQFQLSL